MATKKKGQGFNLAQLETLTKSVNGIEVVIKHPVTDEPIGEGDGVLSFHVLGPASPEYRKAQANVMKSLLNRQNVGKKAKDLEQMLDDDEYEQQNIAVIVACVTDWQNLYFDPNGDVTEPLEFNKENLKTVLVHCPWIRRQLERVILDEKHFMNG